MTDSALNLTPAPQPAVEVLGVLRDLTAGEGLTGLSAALAQLRAYVGEDLERVEHELEHVPRAQDVVGRSLHHLLTLDGKRLRPLCVALAARIGRGGGPAVVRLATAVELVHSATLLHDDVVDDGTMRRGGPPPESCTGTRRACSRGTGSSSRPSGACRGRGCPG